MTEITVEEARARRLARKKRRRRRRLLLTVLALLLALCALLTLLRLTRRSAELPAQATPEEGPETLPATPENTTLRFLQQAELPDWVEVQLVPVNGAGRRGVEFEELNAIVIHYVGNPGTTARQNRDYFAQETTEVSSHFLVGLEGEILQCVPLWEKSSATNHRNRDTLSIEVCHPDDSGVFTPESYDALVRLTVWLCRLCGFDSDDVIRHYDVTGKLCPKHFAEDEDTWQQFRSDITQALSAPQ